MSRPNRTLVRRRRGAAALWGLAAVALMTWFAVSNSPSTYPPWFFVLLLFLVAANLWFWVFEPVKKSEPLVCVGCGRRRPAAEQDAPCPICGAHGARIPALNRLALWAIALFFGGVGGFFVYGGIVHRRPGLFMQGLVWLGISATLACITRNGKINRKLLAKSARIMGIEIKDDYDLLSRHRYPAIRLLVFIASTVVFTAAVLALINRL